MDLTQDQAEFAIRLAVAAAFGLVIGIEREMRDHPAGVRTHLLVAVGACLFTIVSAFGFEGMAGGPTGNPDPTRVASNIVTGVGFLGAGAILREGVSVRGLTTAASLWMVAGIGMAVGVGMYWTSGLAAGITVLSLWLLRPFRTRIRRVGEGAEPEQPGE